MNSSILRCICHITYDQFENIFIEYLCYQLKCNNQSQLILVIVSYVKKEIKFGLSILRYCWC